MGQIYLPDELKWVHSYMWAVDIESNAKHEREDYRGRLLPHLRENFEPDENGNHYWEFDQPILASNGHTYKGLMARRRVSEYTNNERVYELINKYNLADRCLNKKIVIEIDLDELYAANQEGIIPDDEIESIIEIEEGYSLIRVE